MWCKSVDVLNLKMKKGLKQEEKNLPSIDFTVPVDNRLNVKKDEKLYKYLDLVRKLKSRET